MNELSKNDIVGKVIIGIFQTPWKMYDDGITMCDVFVQLDTGHSFQIRGWPDDSVPRITAVDLGQYDVLPVSFDLEMSCIGETICEVVRDSFPGFGLLLSSRRVLVLEAIQPRCIGARVIPIDWDLFSIVRDYWTGIEIAPDLSVRAVNRETE